MRHWLQSLFFMLWVIRKGKIVAHCPLGLALWKCAWFVLWRQSQDAVVVVVIVESFEEKINFGGVYLDFTTRKGLEESPRKEDYYLYWPSEVGATTPKKRLR